MSDFPFIDRLGLLMTRDKKITVCAFDLEKLLSTAPVVRLIKINRFTYETTPKAEYTHNCLALGIQPIRKENAEQILKEFVDVCENIEISKTQFSRLDLSNLYDRARKLLGEK